MTLPLSDKFRLLAVFSSNGIELLVSETFEESTKEFSFTNDADL